MKCAILYSDTNDSIRVAKVRSDGQIVSDHEDHTRHALTAVAQYVATGQLASLLNLFTREVIIDDTKYRLTVEKLPPPNPVTER